VYTVSVHFKEGGTEILEEKILRMMKRDLQNPEKCGTVATPQADSFPTRLRFAGLPGELPERGSV
jgi:hypothetical protein